MIAALFLLAQIAPMPPEPKPILTSVAAIRSNPKKYDGRIVRLHGWVNRCQPSSCAIEERPANASGGPGASLTIGGSTKFYETLQPLIPTYVEFDASVNSNCVASTCNGGTPALTVITLRGVVSPEPPPFEN